MSTGNLGTLVEIIGKLQKPLSKAVMESRFIPSDSKEELIASFGKLHQTLLDAWQRGQGHVPPTPSQTSFARRNTKKLLKKMFPTAVNHQRTPLDLE